MNVSAQSSQLGALSSEEERGKEFALHWRVFMAAAVNARCSALSEISSAIHLLFHDVSFCSNHGDRGLKTHAIVNGTMDPPIPETM